MNTFYAHLCGYSNSLEGMEPGTCVEGTPKALLTESKVSEMCTCVTTPVLLTNSKSQRLLDYSRISGKQLEINLLQFRKEELLGIESDEDHVDEYLDKYDWYANPDQVHTQSTLSINTKRKHVGEEEMKLDPIPSTNVLLDSRLLKPEGGSQDPLQPR